MKTHRSFSLRCLVLTGITLSVAVSLSRAADPLDTITVTVPVHSGWNVLSNPVLVACDTITCLFPASPFSYAFRYDPMIGFYQTNRLPNGIGVWYKPFSPVVFTGGAILSDSIEVAPGWNIVGSISYPVPTARITSYPPGIIASPFFYHDGHHFVVADTIVPGLGYYVKLTNSGHILLTTPPYPGQP